MVFSCDVLLSVPRRRYRKHDVKIVCARVCESCGLIRICPIWFWVWLLCLLGERIAEMRPSDVAEGNILKDTLQANHKSEEATRKHHKAKARSVIKKECGRRPHSKNTLQANQKAEKANRNQHKAKARSVIKKGCGRRPHSKKDPAGKSQVGRITLLALALC